MQKWNWMLLVIFLLVVIAGVAAGVYFLTWSPDCEIWDGPVITSYSIHYTKLYEFDQVNMQTIEVKDRTEWRAWLEAIHILSQGKKMGLR